MKLEVLMSCMHQTDDSLIKKSGIIGDAVVINQCDRNDYAEYNTPHGRARMFSSTERGLTRSRNMAIDNSDADICLLSDDDETFVKDYQTIIIDAYNRLPKADVIIFKMVNRQPSFSDRIQRIKFPKTMKVSSWQISFRKNSLKQAGIRFDELLGAGTDNGAEEELKFLTDCQKSDLKIYYVPSEIASVSQQESTWFKGYDEKFFENRGATTRYILGFPIASIYAFYYVLRKQNLYKTQISSFKALKATFRGIVQNKITKQAKSKQPAGKVF